MMYIKTYNRRDKNLLFTKSYYEFLLLSDIMILFFRKIINKRKMIKMDNNFYNFYWATKHMNIVVTNQCNRRCPFCIAQKNTSKTKTEFLSLDNVNKAVEFAKAEGIKTIALTGGEPTLHPHIIEIAEILHQNGFDLALYTNYDFPDVVKKLDGLIDHIFISYYGQEMPKKEYFKRTQLIMTILLLKDHFKTIQDLEEFISAYKNDAILLFSVPVNVNNYCEEETCSFLDQLTQQDSLFFSLPDGTIVQIHNDCLIKRPDLPKAFVDIDSFSYKMRLDGEISHFYSEKTEKLAEIEDISLRDKLLATHNAKERQKILNIYKGNEVE